ncbi:hypothetical protein, partial [Polaromonas sp. OV174]|uniref:hypothetical protein n=1 Tax=Polaromonas sp. OV174 TaxID=1855300 RepID=UPI001C434D6F
PAGRVGSWQASSSNVQTSPNDDFRLLPRRLLGKKKELTLIYPEKPRNNMVSCEITCQEKFEKTVFYY